MNFAKFVRDESIEIEKTIASGELASGDKTSSVGAVCGKAARTGFARRNFRRAATQGQTAIARMP
jgi:hypothetical protein